MLYNVYDIMVGRMLEVCGSWLGQEPSLHSILLNSAGGPGPGVPGSGRILEAGAHIGAMTVPLARQVEVQGRLLALEPSRLNLQLLTANLALAQVSNVDTHQAALGAVSKGSVPVEEPDLMPFADFRRFGPGKKNRKVPVVSVDQLLGAVDRLDLLRLGLASTAGHGLSIAIAGAVRSLERFQPWVLAELPLRDSGNKLDLKMEVSGDDEAAFLSSMDSSAYDCVRCDMPLGPTEAEPPESWASCTSDPRAQLKAKMLLCGHRSRTSGTSDGEVPDASVWLRAVATCQRVLASEVRKRGVSGCFFWVVRCASTEPHPTLLLMVYRSVACLKLGSTLDPDFNKQHLRARPDPSSTTFSLPGPLTIAEQAQAKLPGRCLSSFVPGAGFCEARAPWP